MTRNQKIFIIVGACIGLLCLVACGVGILFFRNMGNAITNSTFKTPGEAQQAASKIATIDMPAGYTAGEGMSILGMTMVVYKSDSSDVFMMLMDMPFATDMSEANTEQMQRQFEQSYGRNNTDLHVVDTKDVTIRDKPGKIIISEGTSKGAEIRQVTVFFSGKSGLSMLIITGRKDHWDAKAYDKMILSIR